MKTFTSAQSCCDYVRGWTTGVGFPTGAGILSLRHRVWTAFGAHPVPYPVNTEDSFPGRKPAGAWR